MASPTLAGVKRPFAVMAAERANVSSRPLPLDGEDLWKRLRRSPGIESSESLHRGHAGTEFAHQQSRSASHSPPSRTRTPRMAGPAQFEPDASIVLVGMRGSGTSTLAVMASTAMKRRIVDTEQAFLDATGLSTTAFKKTHGSLEYRKRQSGILEGVLARYQRDSIIVSSWVERSVQSLLAEFSTTHLVLHVVRDETAVADYLGVTDVEKLRELLYYTAATFRACANYEFFNVSEVLSRPGGGAGAGENKNNENGKTSSTLDHDTALKSAAPYLTLKRAERHFLRFLSLILPKNTIPYVESAFPLASIPTERRQHTYAMSVPLSRLLSGSLRVDDLETGADAIEIVVDDLLLDDVATRLTADRASRISRVFGHIRRNVVIPIIYSIAWPRPGPLNGPQRLLYLEHVQHGLRLAPEYSGLDLRLDDELFSHLAQFKRTTKIIGTINLAVPDPPSWRDPVWLSYYQKARDLNCDLVRLLRPAAQLEDNVEVNHLRCAVEELGRPVLPLIAFNTGPKGRNSQCFNRILTPIIPEALVDEVRQQQTGTNSSGGTSHVPADITALEATRALHASFMIDAMKLYVLGANVGYSMSPAMHGVALQACGIPHVYRPYSTASLGNIRDLIHDPHFAGASIGLPFKVEVISLTHSLSSHAKAIGAVNTLIPVRHINADGTIPDDALFFDFRNRAGPVLALYGENTDWIGIRACIRRGLSPANAVRPSSSGLVIGAGGMARAAVYAMLQLGVRNIVILNRTQANAEKLVAHFTRLLRRDDLPLLSPDSHVEARFHVIGSRDDPWPDQFRLPTMIISCIPTHEIGDCPAPAFTLPPPWMLSPTGGVVVELAYKYLNTPLLDQVRAEAHRGWVPMDGLDLLPEQGFAQFELFTGRRAPRRLMREEVFRSYPNEQGEANQRQLQPRLENIVEQEP